MNILLIGGSGIISSEICNLSLEKGYNVTILNRGRRKKLINDKAKLVVADLRKESVETIRNKISDKKYDVIIDFISYNTQQLEKTLQISKDLCKQFIFVSSATVYKIKDNTVYNENCEIGSKLWDYAYKKAECEWYLEKNYKSYNLEYTIIRPYVTYGKTRIPYQIAPIEYYTIVNRILMDKPLPICGLDCKCTVTNSKEFAVATVDLFLNEKSYNEAFHITSDCVTTWREIGEILGKKLNKDVKFIDIPIDLLKSKKNLLGFDLYELIGDKANDMVFDNTKIKSVSPNFKGNVFFEDGINETILFYQQNPNMQIINYEWDSRIDCILNSISKDSKNLSLKAYKYDVKLNDKLIYWFARNDFRYKIFILSKKVKNKLKRFLKG